MLSGFDFLLTEGKYIFSSCSSLTWLAELANSANLTWCWLNNSLSTYFFFCKLYTSICFHPVEILLLIPIKFSWRSKILFTCKISHMLIRIMGNLIRRNIVSFTIFWDINHRRCKLLFFTINSFRNCHILYSLIMPWILLFHLWWFLGVIYSQKWVFRVMFTWHNSSSSVYSFSFVSENSWHWL